MEYFYIKIIQVSQVLPNPNLNTGDPLPFLKKDVGNISSFICFKHRLAMSGSGPFRVEIMTILYSHWKELQNFCREHISGQGMDEKPCISIGLEQEFRPLLAWRECTDLTKNLNHSNTRFRISSKSDYIWLNVSTLKV